MTLSNIFPTGSGSPSSCTNVSSPFTPAPLHPHINTTTSTVLRGYVSTNKISNRPQNPPFCAYKSLSSLNSSKRQCCTVLKGCSLRYRCLWRLCPCLCCFAASVRHQEETCCSSCSSQKWIPRRMRQDKLFHRFVLNLKIPRFHDSMCYLPFLCSYL